MKMLMLLPFAWSIVELHRRVLRQHLWLVNCHELVQTIPKGRVRHGVQSAFVSAQCRSRDGPLQDVLWDLGTLHANVEPERLAEQMHGVGIDPRPVLELPRRAKSNDGHDAIPILCRLQPLLGIVDQLVLHRPPAEPRIDLAAEGCDDGGLCPSSLLLLHQVTGHELALSKKFVSVDERERCRHALWKHYDRFLPHQVRPRTRPRRRAQLRATVLRSRRRSRRTLLL
mmetsp:Transcript_1988/g.4906  ORF Transcript_1988/g.4906 Transcript_1988/m.4906 type:complete len:227 (+) Transcript_1988:214-894(+)